jgi:endonuclease I
MSLETALQPQSLALPPVANPLDPEVDIDVLKSVPQHFAIDSEDHANWLIRKIIAAREYATHVKEFAEREVRRAQREEMTLMFLFGRQAERWARGQIERLNGRRKSLSLPAGTLGFRHINPALQVDDEQVVLAWAKDHCPSAVVLIEKLSKTELKLFFEQTGQIPDAGAHVDQGGERFFIR